MTSRPASRLGLILILALVLSGPLAFPADAAADGAAIRWGRCVSPRRRLLLRSQVRRYVVHSLREDWGILCQTAGCQSAGDSPLGLAVGRRAAIHPGGRPAPTPKASCQIGVNGYAYTVKYGDTLGNSSRGDRCANGGIVASEPDHILSGHQVADLRRAIVHPWNRPQRGCPANPAGAYSGAYSGAESNAAPTEPPTATPTPVPTARVYPNWRADGKPYRGRDRSVCRASGVPTATLPSGVAAGSTPVPTLTPAGAQPLPALTPAAVSGRAPACPATFDAYPAAIANFIQASGRTPAMLQSWLESCGVVQEERGGVTMAAIQTPTRTADDLVVIIHDTKADELFPQGTMLVYFNTAKGYVLAGQAEGTGSLGLLATRDRNRDGKVDVFYTDGTCGAHTCFYTLFLYSWDGVAFRDWIEGEPTMAYPVYTIADRTTAGDGEEIVAYGGVIGSAGAGPQRAHTETWGSPRVHPTSCLATCTTNPPVSTIRSWTPTSYSTNGRRRVLDRR